MSENNSPTWIAAAVITLALGIAAFVACGTDEGGTGGSERLVRHRHPLWHRVHLERDRPRPHRNRHLALFDATTFTKTSDYTYTNGGTGSCTASASSTGTPLPPAPIGPCP